MKIEWEIDSVVRVSPTDVHLTPHLPPEHRELHADATTDDWGEYRKSAEGFWFKSYEERLATWLPVEDFIRHLTEVVEHNRLVDTEVKLDEDYDGKALFLIGWTPATPYQAKLAPAMYKARWAWIQAQQVERDRAELEVIRKRRPELFS
jgi:hypothetical protein